MKRCLEEHESTMNEQNEGASCSKSKSCLTSNADESETQMDLINKTTNSDDDNDILNEKRKNYISWDDLFMAISFLSAKRSKHRNTKVGACIVDLDKKIVGIGYNGMPTRSDNCNFKYDKFICFYECHAEMNAILNKNSINLQNCTIYVSVYPCSECTKIIIQSGIKEVVHFPKSNACTAAAKKMFGASGLIIREHKPNQNIILDSITDQSDGSDLSWENFFMATALLMSKRSKDPVSQVGACIVDSDNLIVSTGYNGMPTGCNDDDFPWGKDSVSDLKNKFVYVCHAEMNAIFYKRSINVKDYTIYVTRFPCIECAKIIIQSGIKNVVYLWDPKLGKKKNKSIRSIFSASGVEYRPHNQNRKKLDIILDFSTTD